MKKTPSVSSVSSDAVDPEIDLALVVGGTGKTGRRVASRLKARGIPTRAVSRSTNIPFEWNDRSTWDAALEGVDAAYVTYVPDLAVQRAPEDIREFVGRAQRAGVDRLVLLSGRGEDAAQRCERIVQDVDPKWTVVRSSWFSQNFSEFMFAEPLAQGTLALPAGSIGEPFIDVDDIADVVVAALTEPGHEGEIYEVTGPRVLTFAEAVEEIAYASGRDLSYVQITADEFEKGMRAELVPDELVGLLRFLFETVLDGRNEYVADGVERALGRPSRDFSDFARDAANAGAWTVPALAGAAS